MQHYGEQFSLCVGEGAGREGLCSSASMRQHQLCVHALLQGLGSPLNDTYNMCCLLLPCVLLAAAAMNPAVQGEVWPGVAGVFQVACILASGLLFFVSRTPADGSGSGYEVF